MNSQRKCNLPFCLAATLVAAIIASSFGQTASTDPATGPAPTKKAAKRATTKPAATRAAKVAMPASMSGLLTIAHQNYDAFAAGDWDAGGKQAAALKAAMQALKADLPTPDAEQKKRLGQINSDISALEKAVKAKTLQAALMNSNRIIRVTGVLADTFINKIPQSVWQMEYLARELQVWSTDPADLTKLKATAARIESDWKKLAIDLTARQGDSLVKEFTDEATLTTATTAADFAKLTKPLLTTLDKVENLYAK